MPENQSSNGTPSFGLPDAAGTHYMKQQVDQLVEANKAGFAEIAAMGAQVDPASLIHLRIEILAELVFGTGPGMIQFRLRFERKVAEVLEDLRGQIRKAQLAAGAQASPQQVKQMAAAQGILLDKNGNPLRRPV